MEPPKVEKSDQFHIEEGYKISHFDRKVSKRKQMIDEERRLLEQERALLEAEREVFVVVPDLLTGTSKTDMNDVLVQLGEDAVFEAIKSMKRVTM